MAALEEMATLALNIDTSKVSEGVNKLDDLSHAAQRAETATEKWSRDTEKAMKNMDGLGASIKSVTARVLGLATAYISLSKAMELTREGFAYNEQLENARLGIASVIAATTQLQDAQGKVLEGQEKFNAAQGMSVKMAKALDVASMQSPAGYTDLLTTFQRMLAPSAQLGLQWKDTLDITIRMSNVLSALGVDMKELGRETTAILTGKNLSLSKVAMRLGISKEELASWGKGEELMAKFTKRFEAFKYAGVAVESTMTAVRAYYEDVVQNISGEANTALWDKMKESMLTVADAFYEIDEKSGQFKIVDDIQPIVDLWNEVGEVVGGKVVDSVSFVMDKIKEFGSYLNSVGLSVFFDDLGRSAKIAAAAIIAITVAKKSMTASFTVGGKEVIGIKALQDEIQAKKVLALQEYQLAQAENQRVRSELLLFQATKRRQLAEAEAAGSDMQRRAILAQEKVLTDALSTSNTKLAASMGQVAVASKMTATSMVAMNMCGKAMLTLKAAASGLLAMFGGPWGVALTAAAVGIGYLATQEDRAEKAARLHAEAQEQYRNAIQGATDETGKLNKELDAVQKTMQEAAIKKQTEAFDNAAREMQNRLSDLVKSFKNANLLEYMDSWDASSMLKEKLNIPEEYLTRFQEITEAYRKSPKDVDVFTQSLRQLYDDMEKSGAGTKDTRDKIHELLELAGSPDGIATLISELQKMTGVLNAASTAAEGVKIALQALNGVSIKGLDEVIRDTAVDKYAAGLKGRKQAQARWLANLQTGKGGEKLSLNTIQQIMEQNDYSGIAESDRVGLQTALGNVGDTYGLNQSGKKGGGGGSSEKSMKTAQENVIKLKEEIARLNGEVTKASTDFDKKIRDIQKMGEEAKLSAPEIQALKVEYQKAFQVNTLKEYDKEIMKLRSDTIGLRQIEIADTIKEWEDRLRAAGIEGEEATQKINVLKESLEKEQNYKDLQTASQFLRDLTSMGMAYGESVEVQNQLLEYQAQLFSQSLPPSLQPYIAKWKELQELQNARDPWSGVKRGTMKFVAEQTDYAKQIEDIWTSALTSVGDRFADMCMKGEANFSDLTTSILEDLERMMIKALEAQAISGIMNMIGSAFGSLFSGGGAMSSVGSMTNKGTSAVLAGAGSVKMANGGVFSGGNLHDFSNSVVTSPTTFSYGTHAFAYGAGLMGEAGPEAIMPLTRGADGKLGVRSYNEGSGYPYQSVQPTNTVVNIYNYSGEEASQSAKTDNMGNQSIDVIIGNIAAQQAQKPGSNLNRALRNVTGVPQQITRR